MIAVSLILMAPLAFAPVAAIEGPLVSTVGYAGEAYIRSYVNGHFLDDAIWAIAVTPNDRGTHDLLFVADLENSASTTSFWWNFEPSVGDDPGPWELFGSPDTGLTGAPPPWPGCDLASIALGPIKFSLTPSGWTVSFHLQYGCYDDENQRTIIYDHVGEAYVAPLPPPPIAFGS